MYSASCKQMLRVCKLFGGEVSRSLYRDGWIIKNDDIIGVEKIFSSFTGRS
jgi:hypothetical protein